MKTFYFNNRENNSQTKKINNKYEKVNIQRAFQCSAVVSRIY